MAHEHALAEPYSSIPLIGASGAISAVLGAFLMANPSARITLVLDPTLIHFLHRLTVRLPCWFFLLGWFLLQLAFTLKPQPSNIAFWAHVGGFLGGVVTAAAVANYLSKTAVSAGPYRNFNLDDIREKRSSDGR